MLQEKNISGPIRYTYVGSPLGDILIAGNANGLRSISVSVGSEKSKPEPDWIRDPKPFREAALQLVEYFSGGRRAFDLPLEVRGTAFQKTVWRALNDIPYGETISYFDLACWIDRPSASRAIAAANAHNPFPIVIPCHRVMGKTSTQFPDGMRWRKVLLQLEGALPPEPDRV